MEDRQRRRRDQSQALENNIFHNVEIAPGIPVLLFLCYEIHH